MMLCCNLAMQLENMGLWVIRYDRNNNATNIYRGDRYVCGSCGNTIVAELGRSFANYHMPDFDAALRVATKGEYYDWHPID